MDIGKPGNTFRKGFKPSTWRLWLPKAILFDGALMRNSSDNLGRCAASVREKYTRIGLAGMRAYRALWPESMIRVNGICKSLLDNELGKGSPNRRTSKTAYNFAGGS